MKQFKISRKITERENSTLDTYFREVSKIETLNPEEEVALAQRAKAGDNSALNKLIESNLRFVISVSKQYVNQGLALSDLINEGNLGLIKAARNFDETRGFKFISYSVWWIRQSILLALAEQSRMIRLPQNKIGILGKIRRAHAILEQKLERPPETHELAQYLKIPEKEIEQTLKSNTSQISFDAPLQEGETANLYDLLPNPDLNTYPDNNINRSSLSKDLERVLSTLSTREAKVIRYIYGIGMLHPLTMREISEKMGLSCERIRQIKNIALRKLRSAYRSRLLKIYLG